MRIATQHLTTGRFLTPTLTTMGKTSALPVRSSRSPTRTTLYKCTKPSRTDSLTD